MNHPVRLIRHRVPLGYEDWEAEIDEEIADVVLGLWKHGIKTDWSCQDKDGRAWIQMSGENAFKLNAVLGESASLMRGEYNGGSDPEVMLRGAHHVYFSLEDVPKIVESLKGTE